MRQCITDNNDDHLVKLCAGIACKLVIDEIYGSNVALGLISPWLYSYSFFPKKNSLYSSCKKDKKSVLLPTIFASIRIEK
jgi:hypothetical protein